MTYDWTDPSEGNRLPVGTYTVCITKISRTTKREGQEVPFQDGSGNPKIYINFQATDGRDGSFGQPLDGPFVWQLRKILQAVLSPQDLEYLTKSGLTPRDFMDPAKTDPILIGKWLVVKGVKNKDFINWTPMPLPSDAVPAAAPQASDADVPF